MVSHVGLGSVQQSLEFQSICVPVRYDVAHLTDDSGEDEHANEVTNYGEHVPGHKRGEYVEGAISIEALSPSFIRTQLFALLLLFQVLNAEEPLAERASSLLGMFCIANCGRPLLHVGS